MLWGMPFPRKRPVLLFSMRRGRSPSGEDATTPNRVTPTSRPTRSSMNCAYRTSIDAEYTHSRYPLQYYFEIKEAQVKTVSPASHRVWPTCLILWWRAPDETASDTRLADRPACPARALRKSGGNCTPYLSKAQLVAR